MDKKKKRALIGVGVGGSFVALVGLIVYLAASELVTLEMAKLMLAALLGMYVGFGFLILVYLFIRNME
jgi:hypothetical protein